MHCFRERKTGFSLNEYTHYEKRSLKSDEIVVLREDFLLANDKKYLNCSIFMHIQFDVFVQMQNSIHGWNF